jgi:hypothetical protein
MCKEMLVIWVNRVVDPRRKLEGRGGGGAQGVADSNKRLLPHMHAYLFNDSFISL